MDNEKINVLVVEPEKKPYAKEISWGFLLCSMRWAAIFKPSILTRSLWPSSVTRKRS